jgi:hypothetical protein
VRRVALLVALLAAGACGKSEPPNQSKMMPKLAPPPTVDLPADLEIIVEIDGAAAPAIDRAKLLATPPDFADAERRAWRLPTLVGAAAAAPGVTIYASGAQDVTVGLQGDAEHVPVIMVSRRGDVIATVLDAKQPFPDYHGQGGRLGRPPDALPRVLAVSKLKIVSAAAPVPAPPR